MYVTTSQRHSANRVDLAAWLLTHHPEAVIRKGDSVLLRMDEHVSVKDGYCGYQDWRTGETGNNVEYLMRYLNYTYPDAVIALLDQRNVSDPRPSPQSTNTQSSGRSISLPGPATHMKNVYAYLIARKIPRDVIDMLVRKGLLYQSEKGNNAVFVTPQRDYCEIRGTNTFADRRCKHRTECAQYDEGYYQWCKGMDGCDNYKADSFHGCCKAKSDRFWYFAVGQKPYSAVYICEAAIDAISLYALHRSHGKKDSAVYISIGGVGNQKTIDRIKSRCDNAIIATDNDFAGNRCRHTNDELATICPVGKDWNADLITGAYYESNDKGHHA